MAHRSIEWRTVALAAVVHITWFGAVSAHGALPWWASIGVLGLALCWFMSLQHEVIHLHPTKSPRVNRLFVPLPLDLFLPIARFRASHIEHHATELTIPALDPESFYVAPDLWSRFGSVGRAALWIDRTLLGRMTVGNVWRLVTVMVTDIGRSRADRRVRRVWLLHGAGVLVTLVVVRWLGMSVVEYVAAAVLASALVLIRSFAEHRAVDENHESLSPEQRTAVVRSSGLFGLLFLHNNLHVTHHAAPATPWYELPAVHREMGSDQVAAAGAGLYSSYGEIFWRFLVRPFCQPCHPTMDSSGA